MIYILDDSAYDALFSSVALHVSTLSLIHHDKVFLRLVRNDGIRAT